MIHLPFGNLFHLGYVVCDMATVIANMGTRFGIEQWKILPLPDGAPAKAIGFAYANDTMLELVEVDPDQPLLPIHAGWVPERRNEARLNHVAYLLDSEEELQATRVRFEASGIRTAWLDSFGDIFTRYYYADTTAELGHFTELVCLGPTGRDFLASIPRN